MVMLPCLIVMGDSFQYFSYYSHLQYFCFSEESIFRGWCFVFKCQMLFFHSGFPSLAHFSACLNQSDPSAGAAEVLPGSRSAYGWYMMRVASVERPSKYESPPGQVDTTYELINGIFLSTGEDSDSVRAAQTSSCSKACFPCADDIHGCLFLILFPAC